MTLQSSGRCSNPALPLPLPPPLPLPLTLPFVPAEENEERTMIDPTSKDDPKFKELVKVRRERSKPVGWGGLDAVLGRLGGLTGACETLAYTLRRAEERLEGGAAAPGVDGFRGSARGGSVTPGCARSAPVRCGSLIWADGQFRSVWECGRQLDGETAPEGQGRGRRLSLRSVASKLRLCHGTLLVAWGVARMDAGATADPDQGALQKVMDERRLRPVRGSSASSRAGSRGHSRGWALCTATWHGQKSSL
ncbi:hypothetical protein QTO34_012888 [Cnephaeus nilssonii]|uniref:Uncharacterized protein n=1 Tax=Cnephaeus nilssonii TaxID=3371016 RepID=A0AA40LD14_CNENI|nr:hypothetical protein QTO34_012888 [Eptesicus nilssonii]